jgi:hypothetical protein
VPPEFYPYAASIPQEAAAAPYPPLTQSDEEWLSRAFDVAFENILRSSIVQVPSFPTSQPDTREEYYLPQAYVPYQTAEPREVDHCQRGGQSTFVNLNIPYPQTPFVGGLNDDACHPLCLALPPPRSPHSPLLLISEHPPLPPEIPTNHTRPFHERKDQTFETYSVQLQDGSIEEQDERLAQRYSKFPFPSK